MEPELGNALRKNRVEDLEKRAFRWLERSFWRDIVDCPDDPLDKRTVRLKKLFDSAPTIPKRQGDGEHFPISVFIEYDSILKLLEPIFKRRPTAVTDLSAAKASAIGRLLEHRRIVALEALNEKQWERWKRELLQRANCIIPIECWPNGEGVLFTEDVIVELTAQTAALRILGAKMDLGEDAVLKLVKEGKKMLPPRFLEKLEKAYAVVENNDSWQFLNQLDPLK